VNLLGALLLVIIVLLIVGSAGSLHIDHCANAQQGICITWTTR
jgi:hypothetical protein